MSLTFSFGMPGRVARPVPRVKAGNVSNDTARARPGDALTSGGLDTWPVSAYKESPMRATLISEHAQNNQADFRDRPAHLYRLDPPHAVLGSTVLAHAAVPGAEVALFAATDEGEFVPEFDAFEFAFLGSDAHSLRVGGVDTEVAAFGKLGYEVGEAS